jgi:hypothetical protein
MAQSGAPAASIGDTGGHDHGAAGARAAIERRFRRRPSMHGIIRI